MIKTVLRQEMSEQLESKADFATEADARKIKIRAGIVGAGLMGSWHAHTLERVGGKVVGVSDVNLAVAEQLAAKFRGAVSYAHLESMIEEQKLDVLHVCSPTTSHEQIAEKALAAGIHVLVEKPVSSSAEKTVELYRRADAHNAKLCPVHQFAFQDGVKKAEKLIPKIGRIVHIEGNICSAGGTELGDEQIDLTAIDILPHPLSLMQKFLETGIAEMEWSVVQPDRGELRIYGENQQKISMSIFVSMNSRPTANYFRILGTSGTIHIDLFHGYSLIEPGKTSRINKITHPFDLAVRHFTAAAANLTRRTLRRETAYPGLRQLISEFYRSVKLGTESPITPDEAISVAQIRDLLIARSGIGQIEEFTGY